MGSWDTWAQHFMTDGTVDRAVIFCEKSGAVWGSAGRSVPMDESLLPNILKKSLGQEAPMPFIDSMQAKYLRNVADEYNVIKFKPKNEEDENEKKKCSAASAIEIRGPAAGCRVILYSATRKPEAMMNVAAKTIAFYQ